MLDLFLGDLIQGQEATDALVLDPQSALDYFLDDHRDRTLFFLHLLQFIPDDDLIRPLLGQPDGVAPGIDPGHHDCDRVACMIQFLQALILVEELGHRQNTVHEGVDVHDHRILLHFQDRAFDDITITYVLKRRVQHAGKIFH